MDVLVKKPIDMAVRWMDRTHPKCTRWYQRVWFVPTILLMGIVVAVLCFLETLLYTFVWLVCVAMDSMVTLFTCQIEEARRKMIDAWNQL